MTYDYITIDIKAVTNEYLAKVRPDYEINIKSRTLLYKISNDIYYISLYPTDEWDEFTCKTQEEFEQKVQEYKLLKLLN